MFRLVVGAILSYLIGGFPTGVVLTRRRYGLDVREMGSGNIGATNVTRVFGWWAGVLVFAVDVCKGALPLLWIEKYFPGDTALISVCGAFLVLGHCYTPYLKLRGGKGVATGFGVIAVALPWAAMISAVVYAALLATVRISAVGSLGGMLTMLGYIAVVQPERWKSVMVLCVSFVVFVRHRENVKRLWNTSKVKKSS